MRKSAIVFLLLLTAPLLASGAEHGGDSAVTTILKLLNLLIFLGILVYFSAKPFQKFVESRGEAITRGLKEAREKEAGAASMLNEVDDRIQAFRQEEALLKERLSLDLKRMETETRERIQRDVTTITESMDRLIEQQTREAREELRRESLELAVSLAEKHLAEHVTEEDRRTFARRMVEELSG